MRKLLNLNNLVAAIAIAAMACSTTQHDSVQTNSPAPEVLRGASLSNAPMVNSAGPASMTTPSTEALAITAASANVGGRFLGYIEGIGPSPSGNNMTVQTGQFVPPALGVPNPPLTVNASISSPAIPVVTSGAAGEGGVFLATSAAPVATTAAVSAAPTTGATASATAAPVAATTVTTNAVTAAPVVVTPATVATPTNTANVLTAGQFAAGVGGATNSGTTIVPNSGPLPLAQGTTLANGNTGTLTPTISSSRLPSTTVASNPPLASAGTARVTTVPATNTVASATTPRVTGTASGRVILGPGGMTSSSTITNNSTISNSNGAVITASEAEQLAARQALTSTTAAVTAAPTTVTARQRALRVTNTTASATLSAPARQRAVRVTTTPSGRVILTNTNDNGAFMERVDQVRQPAPQQ